MPVPDTDEASRRRAFVGMVVHELRGPLTVAMGHAELLAESAADFDETTRAEMAQELLGAVERVGRVLEDLVLVTTPAAGRLARAPLRLDAELEAAVRDEPDAGALAGLLAGAPPVSADPVATRRVLAALVANGRQATPGRPVPTLRWRAEEDAVVVEVVDPGNPILPEERALALDRLARPASGLRSRRNPGLEMTVARVLAEGMGGGIEVDDEPAGGCVFRLRLPRASS